jgi:hypothetical protein
LLQTWSLLRQALALENHKNWALTGKDKLFSLPAVPCPSLVNVT